MRYSTSWIEPDGNGLRFPCASDIARVLWVLDDRMNDVVDDAVIDVLLWLYFFLQLLPLPLRRYSCRKDRMYRMKK